MPNAIERLRYMRRTTSKITTKLVPTGSSVPLVEQSDDRVAVVIGSVASGTLRLTTDQNSSGAVGIMMNSSTGPLALNIWDHGAIVKGPIHATHSAGGVNVATIETFGPP